MNQSTCPICKSPNPQGNITCTNCGANIQILQIPEHKQEQEPTYTNTYGETDLLENQQRTPKSIKQQRTLPIIITLCIIAITSILTLQLTTNQNTPREKDLTPDTNQENLNFITNTQQPTPNLATTTPGPPTPSRTATATTTATQGPCSQEIQPGDSLIALAARCGHQSLDVIQLILELNDLSDANQIQVGQTIQIPWPTTTPNPEQTQEASTDNNQTSLTTNQTIQVDRLNPPTETLQPGVIWHQIVKDENIITIAVQYGATLRILSELNPEVTFSQCDFGLGTGGPNCIVQIYEGQLIRVPAPTPTPTIQPTLSGSETPTPTATPTFNAPSPLSPQQSAFFTQDAIITLRWTSTGALSENQSYHITVVNQTTGDTYTATTDELSFIIPSEWQHQTDERHNYSWNIAVISDNNPDNPQFETEPRQFIWQGRSDS